MVSLRRSLWAQRRSAAQRPTLMVCRTQLPPLFHLSHAAEVCLWLQCWSGLSRRRAPSRRSRRRILGSSAICCVAPWTGTSDDWLACGSPSRRTPTLGSLAIRCVTSWTGMNAGRVASLVKNERKNVHANHPFYLALARVLWLRYASHFSCSTSGRTQLTRSANSPPLSTNEQNMPASTRT